MKRSLLLSTLTAAVLLSMFALYSFRNQQTQDSSHAIVVVSKTEIAISYGNGRHENVSLKEGRYVDNDNATVNVFNKMGMQGYNLVTSSSAWDGSIYFVFKK